MEEIFYIIELRTNIFDSSSFDKAVKLFKIKSKNYEFIQIFCDYKDE